MVYVFDETGVGSEDESARGLGVAIGLCSFKEDRDNKISKRIETTRFQRGQRQG
jgi:hypothetical protein